MNSPFLALTLLIVLAQSRLLRDRKMGGGGGCGLACYRYNKCRDNTTSSAEGNLRYEKYSTLG